MPGRWKVSDQIRHGKGFEIASSSDRISLRFTVATPHFGPQFSMERYTTTLGDFQQLWTINSQFSFAEERTYVQITLATISLLSVAKDSAEHHFYELGGKNRVPSCRQFLPALTFYAIQIGLRLPSLALLTIYLGDLFGIFLVAMLPANFVLANLTLNTLTAKVNFIVNILTTFSHWPKCIFNEFQNVWTGLLSTLSPICFVAKEKVRDHLSKCNKYYTPITHYRNSTMINEIMSCKDSEENFMLTTYGTAWASLPSLWPPTPSSTGCCTTRAASPPATSLTTLKGTAWFA